MKSKQQSWRMAFFISPHGYGHAARAAAVMEAIHDVEPLAEFEIFTKVPRWFFDSSLSARFVYHGVVTDIGLVQKNPFHADFEKTLDRLDQFYPPDPQTISLISHTLIKKNCRAVICDIAPVGIPIAKEAGIPSLLVENFTWDWIYEGYLNEEERLRKHMDCLRAMFQEADYHIQTEPVCSPGSADMTTSPVSRRPRTSGPEIRRKLGIPAKAKAVMITMGGIPEQYPFLGQLMDYRNIYFIIPGAGKKRAARGNLVLLPHRSGFFHPDLVNASDAVVGKVGYSTVAEVYRAGVPFGYVERSGFRENHSLVSFIEKKMRGIPMSEDDFRTGNWLSLLPGLLALPRMERSKLDGSYQVAQFVRSLLTSS